VRVNRTRLPVLGAVLVVAVVLTFLVTSYREAPPSRSAPVSAAAGLTLATPPPATPLTVVPPPAGLPVIDYGPAPTGFPADPAPLSTAWLREGLHPLRRVGAYDAPGGRPLAFLAPTILGVPVTTPIVERRAGWAAVLLPSANRTVAWVPPGPSWKTVPLRDQLVVVRGTHRMTWLRDGAVVRSWAVTLGAAATPTPLGRTFILGRSSLRGSVYAGTDVFALGAVPDDPDAVPTSLRGAHIGIHTWYHDRALGQDTTDGCIRLTKTGQELLLAELAPGTEVVVIDS